MNADRFCLSRVCFMWSIKWIYSINWSTDCLRTLFIRATFWSVSHREIYLFRFLKIYLIYRLYWFLKNNLKNIFIEKYSLTFFLLFFYKTKKYLKLLWILKFFQKIKMQSMQYYEKNNLIINSIWLIKCSSVYAKAAIWSIGLFSY